MKSATQDRNDIGVDAAARRVSSRNAASRRVHVNEPW